MSRDLWSSCAVATFMLAACGAEPTSQSDAPATSEAVATKAPAVATGPASAEEVAAVTRGEVRCPPRPAALRSTAAPVDDVVGVRPGMSWDGAANAVMCDHPLLVVTETTSRNYDIETYGTHVRQGFEAKFAEARVEKTSKQILKEMQDEAMRRGSNAYVAPLKPGQIRYFVSSMGAPGKERVISVAREEYYPEGKLPTVDNLKQALVRKYGAPSQTQETDTLTYLWWEYDPSGRKVTETSPLHMQCRINVSPDAGTSLSPDCGTSVGALIKSADANPGLAHSLAVTSQNGAEGYALLKTTEQALLQADQARKAKELRSAATSADAPTL